mmetsp:Transcript_2004/g.5604  ORF Transcript_2004/g.5604 Transcript_2004/m.5604 type:complete len:427 (-) Transcript_2004:425-1705(-)
MSAPSLLRNVQVVLRPEEEWRFEVDHGAQVVVTLKDGKGEIFGTEVVKDQRYSFSAAKLAVFTWHGCTLEVEGAFTHQYTALETPMLGVLQFHDELEQRRNSALASLSAGPRVMVVGTEDSGKTTMCRILANYAARRGHGVTFVDLDVDQQMCGPPGIITATAWHTPLDLVHGMEYAAPLAYWVGRSDVSEHMALFRQAVLSMASMIHTLMGQSIAARMAGLIVNTCGWVDGEGYDALVHAAELLGVDTIVVIADDRLYSRITARFAHARVSVIKAPKSGGVVVRSKAFKHECRMDQLRQYFYGIAGQLCPSSTVIPFSSVTLMAIEEAPPPPPDTLPVGVKAPKQGARALVKAPAHWSSLVKSILAVSASESAEEMSVLGENITGIVFVTHVDMEAGRATVLTPSPSDIPGTVLLCGHLKWLESR